MAAAPRYFVVPGPGTYSEVTNVLWSSKKLEDAKAMTPRGYVVRLGDRKAGSKWYPRDEADHPVIWEKAKPAHATKAPRRKSGEEMPADAWRWQNVRMKHRGRELLGTVRHVRRDPVGKLHLVVHHFNGEPWPMEPVASSVKIV